MPHIDLITQNSINSELFIIFENADCGMRYYERTRYSYYDCKLLFIIVCKLVGKHAMYRIVMHG